MGAFERLRVWVSGSGYRDLQISDAVSGVVFFWGLGFRVLGLLFFEGLEGLGFKGLFRV